MIGGVILNNISCFTLSYDPLNTAHPGGYDRCSAGQGFEGHKPEAFVVGRKNAQIGSAIKIWQFLLFNQAQEVLKRLGDQYCKAYFGGIVCERRAKVHLERGGPGSGRMVYAWLRKAMDNYETALNSCSPGNQDAVLRWNTCARILMQHPDVVPAPEEAGEQMLE